MFSAVHTPSQLTNIPLWPLDFGFSIFILVSIYHFANNTPKPWSTKYFSCSTRLYTTDYWLLIRVARTRTRKAFVGRFPKVRLDIYFKPRLLISPRPLKCSPVSDLEFLVLLLKEGFRVIGRYLRKRKERWERLSHFSRLLILYLFSVLQSLTTAAWLM